MPPKRKVTAACKAMKFIGIPEDEVKPVLNELLELYGNKWNLIEEDNYRVLLEVLLEKKHEQDKSVEGKKKEAHSNQKAKVPVREANKDKIVVSSGSNSESEDSEDSKPPVKRLRRRHQEEQALVPVDNFNSEPLGKRLHRRHQEERALVPVDNSNSELVITPSKRAYQDKTELPSGSQNWSDPEDSEPLILKRLRPRGRQNWPDAEPSQTCGKEVAESTQMKVWNEQTKSKPVSPLQHRKNGFREPYTSRTCPVPEAKEAKEPSQPYLSPKRAKPDSLSCQEKEKISKTPEVAPGERRSISETGTVIRPFEKLKVEPYVNLTPVENVLDMYHEKNFNLPRDEPFDDNQLLDEVPLAVILPEGSSNGNGSDAKADGLEFPDYISLDMDDKAPPCVDGLSNGKSSDVNEDGSKFLEPESLDVKEKCDGVSEVSQFDVASSSKGEVKISLICNSSERSDFHIPSLDAVLKVVEEKISKSYGLTEPNFSFLKLMTEFCECFWAMGTGSAVDEHLRSIDIPASKISDTQEGHDGKDGYEGNQCIPSSLSSGSVRYQNLIKVIPQIPKPIAPSGLGGLHCIAGFKIKDMENICGESDRSLKLVKDPQSSNSSNKEIVKKHQPPSPIANYCGYVDDITKGQEKVKISLLNGRSAEDLPTFSYIPKNLIYNKGYVSFALARISDEDCCSNCIGDCLLSPVPCACARETGGEFAYMPGGSLKERFLEESISINRNPKEHQYFYCKNCPLEKNKEKSDKCKGHLLRRFIKECWAKCGCNKNCGNRIVQRGISVNLQVFLTAEGKGWGLRTLQDLPRGAFVCEYVGEIVTNSELYERNLQKSGNERHTYPVLLDADWGSEVVLKDEEALCLDATEYGNVARFINHRCYDANLVEIPVEAETPDHHYYHLAFFTTRKVAAMEELTWDYGIDFDDRDHPVKAFKCQCGSEFCRGLKVV